MAAEMRSNEDKADGAANNASDLSQLKIEEPWTTDLPLEQFEPSDAKEAELEGASMGVFEGTEKTEDVSMWPAGDTVKYAGAEKVTGTGIMGSELADKGADGVDTKGSQ